MYNNSPYRQIPNELLGKYTLGGKIPIGDWWMNNSRHYSTPWTTELINEYMYKFRPENVNDTTKGSHHPDFTNSYGRIPASHLLEAFEKYNIKEKKVAVIGSGFPWIEALLLHLNNKVTMIEYNVPQCNDPRISCKNYFSYFKTLKNEFDCIVTYSSVEHSGLGRYGDPLDPDGDLKTMDDIHNALKSDGLLIFGVPIGVDALMWNVHRIYGKLRLPLLFKDWKEIEWLHYDRETQLNSHNHFPLKVGHQKVPEPVIVLSKK